MSKRYKSGIELCDKCRWLYTVIDPKTRRKRGYLCALWLDGIVGTGDDYMSMSSEKCFEPK